MGEPAEITYGGGGTDQLWLLDVIGSELYLKQDYNDLLVTNKADFLDNGVIDSGVKISNFFSGGDHVIEFIYGSDGVGYDLSAYV